MTYEEALREVNRRLVFGSKLGLERMEALCAALGDPQKKLRFVHVAGTNGKGTTSTVIASVLTAAGYKTGLYTSPYVLDFRERFRLNGEMIGKERLIEAVEAVAKEAARLEANGDVITEFEFITALAFWWYAKENCDFVVLEVGMGGRFDATNVIDPPECAVIVSISLDHTAVLGDTLEEIAFEKAGIIKHGTPVSLYPRLDPAARSVIERLASARGARCVTADETRAKVLRETVYGTEFTWDGLPLCHRYTGEHQLLNAVNALTALELLREKGYAIPDEALQKGFREASVPARMEILSDDPLVLLDGGHNPGCAKALHEVLQKHVAGRRITAVIGIMADKDSGKFLEYLAPHFAKIVTVRPENPRALSAEALAETARRFCPDVTAAQSIGEALALSKVEKGEALVLCGSFYLAAEIRDAAREMYK